MKLVLRSAVEPASRPAMPAFQPACPKATAHIISRLGASMLRFARLFRNPGVVEDLNRGRGAEMSPVVQDPDDLLVARHLDQLRPLPVSAARADDGVSVREARRR